MNLLSKYTFVSATIALCLGCTTLKQGSSGPVTLELRGKPGEASETRYYSNSRTHSYTDTQLVRDRQEAVDFTVRTSTVKVEPVTGNLHLKVKTLRKDGTTNLHELAFPETNEEIDYVVTKTGKVLLAGVFPPQSIFFVPSLPLPNRKVVVGDTWPLSHTWYSARDAIPLRLEVIAIFKDLVKCHEGMCADLEISGSVGLENMPTSVGARFSSRVWGRLLFSIERGEILWSEMRSQENMVVKNERVHVSSCMVSEQKVKKDFQTKFECDPAIEQITKIPRL